MRHVRQLRAAAGGRAATRRRRAGEGCSRRERAQAGEKLPFSTFQAKTKLVRSSSRMGYNAGYATKVTHLRFQSLLLIIFFKGKQIDWIGWIFTAF